MENADEDGRELSRVTITGFHGAGENVQGAESVTIQEVTLVVCKVHANFRVKVALMEILKKSSVKRRKVGIQPTALEPKAIYTTES